jgi:hypothetical protein
LLECVSLRIPNPFLRWYPSFGISSTSGIFGLSNHSRVAMLKWNSIKYKY